MRPLLLLAALSALSACSGAGCMEGMANTCRLLGGSPDQAALYRSANPVFNFPVYAPYYMPHQASQPVSCSSYRVGHLTQTTCN